MGDRRDELRAIVDGYVEDVLAGRRVVGKLERWAVERHVRDLERADVRFDWRAAFEAMEFIERHVRFTKTPQRPGGPQAGDRYRFSEADSWAAFFVASVCGWEVHTDDGWIRRYREAYMSVARGNAKTFWAAIFALLFYVGMGYPAPEVYIAATQRQQAAKCWKQAAAFVKKSPAMADVVGVHRSQWEMVLQGDVEASFRALSRNDDEFDGFATLMFVLDEFHAHPDGGMYDVLTSGLGKHPDALALLTTTAGSDPSSACRKHERVLEQLLDPASDVEDDGTFAYIARIDERDEKRWDDEQVWKKANPNLGVSIDTEQLRAEARKAKNNQRLLGEFKRKRLNIWTSSETAWVPMSVWDRNAGAPEFRPGDELIVAYDCAKRDDWAARVALCHRDGLYHVDCRFWIPEELIEERAKESKIPLQQWIDAGLVDTTHGSTIDQDAMGDDLRELVTEFNVREAPFDPHQSVKLMTELEAEGLPVFEFHQGRKFMSPAIVELEAALAEGRLLHGGNPVLRWMVTNVVVRYDTGGRPLFNKSDRARKIDGPVCLVMAFYRAIVRDEVRPSLVVA